MFICQKCGWRDYPCYRGHRWTMYATYCYVDELKEWQPDVVEALLKDKQIELHGYFYNLIEKRNIVIRIPADLKDYWKRGHTEEKYHKHTGQTKLLSKGDS